MLQQFANNAHISWLAFAKVVLMAHAKTATSSCSFHTFGLPRMACWKSMLKQRGGNQAFVEEYELAPKGSKAATGSWNHRLPATDKNLSINLRICVKWSSFTQGYYKANARSGARPMWKTAVRHSGDAEISLKQKEVRSAKLQYGK